MEKSIVDTDMKKSKLLIYLGVILFFYTSCNQDKKANQNLKNDIAFDTLRVNQKHYYKNDTTLSSCSLNLSFIYPSHFENDTVLKKLQKAIINLYFDDGLYGDLVPADAVSKYAAAFNAVYEETIESNGKHLEESDGDDPFFTVTEDLKANILYNENDFLSFQVVQQNTRMEDIAFTQYKNCVLDVRTGNQLREEDIFIPDYEQDLHKLFIAHLLKANNAREISDIDNDDVGYNNLQSMTPNRNFYINGDGITYVFNSGEYSTPQLDAIVITLPYEEIKPFLKSGSPLSRIFKL